MSRQRSLSPPHEVKPILLGVFGVNNKISERTLIENVLNLILQELCRLPDKVLVPLEGNSSLYIQSWAETLGIPYQTFTADWKRNGKTAGIMRDSRIQNECTHALVFLAPKSTRYEKFAERMAISKKSPKTVFTASYQDSSLTMLEHDPDPDPPKEPARKSDSGKAPPLPPTQTRLNFGSLKQS